MCIEKKDMPKIIYTGLDDKEHRYYPDFYIPKNNIIVEVKSDYTYKVDLEINIRKKESTKKLGFNYLLLLFDRSLHRIETIQSD